MKKAYIIPNMGTQFISVTNMLAESGNGLGSSEKGIGSGGIDTDGSKEPSVKEAFEFSWE